DVIDEPWVLMAESVVVLPPHMRAQQIVERGDRSPPGNLVANLQPFRVLMEYGIDDVDERLVAGKEPVPARQEIAFQPTLTLVLTEHFHHPAIRRQVILVWKTLRHPSAICDFQHVLPTVGIVLIRTEEAEISALHIELHRVAQ